MWNLIGHRQDSAIDLAGRGARSFHMRGLNTKITARRPRRPTALARSFSAGRLAPVRFVWLASRALG